MDRDLVPRCGGVMLEKIRWQHRERLAIVYIGQYTVQRVERQQESTELQHALVGRAAQFGWTRETIVVVDDDLGRSAMTLEGRFGFQRLVAEVSLGNVGLVLGVEMSRLARLCREWRQLLEICTLFDTLIADADGLYDPTNHNDRLLLGLKEPMSEAELHVHRPRMLEARRAKARGCELGETVPMGYLRRPSGEVIFDPDEQAQATIRLIFDLFERLDTIGKVMLYLVEHDIRMPARVPSGARKGELEWHRANRASLQDLFATPIYAGAYVYGVRPSDRRAYRPSTGRRLWCAEEGDVFLCDRVPAYITWNQYRRNQAQLHSGRAAWTATPRAGSALLCGVITCGRCGRRMTAAHHNNGRTTRYACTSMKSNCGDPFCQSLAAAPLDTLMAQLLLKTLEPAALEARLALANDLEAERAALDHDWQPRLKRASDAAERACRQYHACELENRLVESYLERDWEEALAEQARLETEYGRVRGERLVVPTSAELLAIRNLAQDLPGLWRAETTTQEERQIIVRLLLERILVEVVNDTEQVRITCHWHGGSRTSHQLIRPVARMDQLSTYEDLLARVRELHRTGHGLTDVAAILNREGWRPAKRRETFNARMVDRLLLISGMRAPKYRRRKTDLGRQAEEWTPHELAEHLGLPQPTLYRWIQEGRLPSRRIPGRRAMLVHADEAAIAALKAIRAGPIPWSCLPRSHFRDSDPETQAV
jgi:excisionase family DNA binding protein